MRRVLGAVQHKRYSNAFQDQWMNRRCFELHFLTVNVVEPYLRDVNEKTVRRTKHQKQKERGGRTPIKESKK